MVEKYLPIGSIVKLKSSNNEIMIIGYYSVEYNDKVEIYDYMGCVYPEGLLLKNNLISFNHVDIESCLFKGYVDEKYTIMQNKFLNNGKEDEVNDQNDYDIFKIIDEDDVNDSSAVATKELENIDEDMVSKTKKEIDSLFDIGESLDEEVTEMLQDSTETKDEFVMPHYRFDENGIIISE